MVDVFAAHATGSPVVEQPVDDRLDVARDSSDQSLGPLIGIAVMGAVLVFGLRAIKRQRDEGRRSKLPPIG